MIVGKYSGIEFPDRDAWELTTPRKLIDYIAEKLSADSIAPATCLSQQAFHRLRSAIIEVTGLPRIRIRPSTTLEDILPEKIRIQNWTRLQKMLNVSRWPTLTRPLLLVRLLLYLHLTALLVLLLFLCTKLPVKMSFCLAIAITLIVVTISVQATTSCATYFQPAGYIQLVICLGFSLRIIRKNKVQENGAV
jgi:hypothetical protein